MAQDWAEAVEENVSWGRRRNVLDGEQTDDDYDDYDSGFDELTDHTQTQSSGNGKSGRVLSLLRRLVGKKLVGGKCFLSPTTTSRRQRETRPKASPGRDTPYPQCRTGGRRQEGLRRAPTPRKGDRLRVAAAVGRRTWTSPVQ